MAPDEALRERLMEAAVLLVQEGAADRLTLECVASAADVSREEAVRIFPTVGALATAVAARGYETHKAMIMEAMGDDDAPGAYLRGYVASAFPPDGSGKANFAPILASILRTGPFDFEGLTATRRHHADEDAAIVDDGIEPVLARIIRFAVDGLYMNDVFGMCELSAEDRRAILDRLQAMTRAAPSQER